jgi:hypothetical protein
VECEILPPQSSAENAEARIFDGKNVNSSAKICEPKSVNFNNKETRSLNKLELIFVMIRKLDGLGPLVKLFGLKKALRFY